MTRIDKVLKELSELYEFNRKTKAYDVKKPSSNRWKKTLKEKENDAPARPARRNT
jgi:hypothetical protein